MKIQNMFKHYLNNDPKYKVRIVEIFIYYDCSKLL